MFFKTQSEVSGLLQFAGFQIDELTEKESLENSCPGLLRFYFEKQGISSFALAKFLISCLGPFRNCLLSVTEFGIWPSSENSHLYYRLRSSYGDNRLIGEAPGLYFLDYEAVDLTTFVDLIIQFGWGAHLVSVPSSPSIFIAHDGWARIETKEAQKNIIEKIEPLGVPWKIE